MKPKLKILVGGATHFLRWELPPWANEFQLVTKPGTDVVLVAFGPDVLAAGASVPARRRFAVLFPGFGWNPYHNLEHRERALTLIENYYDRVFINPGPLEKAYASSTKLELYPFGIHTDAIPRGPYRTRLGSLLHASADYPQKDWKRSVEIMQRTGLEYQVYPPRTAVLVKPSYRVKAGLNRLLKRVRVPPPFHLLPSNYVDHSVLMKMYTAYDGFVHVAAPIPHQIHLDGKYTATFLEAGATGAILFWHDTFGLGNDLETVFDLPKDPAAAARQILEIRAGLDVQAHSRRTAQEIRDRFNVVGSVQLRAKKIKDLL